MARKIALVIDDADVLDMMQAALAAHDYESLPCRPSLLDCRGEVAYAQPDFILVDVPLGRPAFTADDALQLIEALRADPAIEAIPILVCATVEKALAAKMSRLEVLGCDFIAKPFELPDLLARMEHRLQAREDARE